MERGDDPIGNDKVDSRSSRLKVVIIILLILVVVLLGTIVAFAVLGNGDGKDQQANGGNLRESTAGSGRMIVTQEDADTAFQSIEEQVAEGMFECQMSMTWNYHKGGSESNDAYVANSTNNRYPIYFDVYLGEEEEDIIYSSPLLPVGTEWKNFELEKSLEPGEYKARVMYTLVQDEETQEVISNAAFIVTLNILD